MINNDRESFQKKTNLIICWNIKQVDIIGRTSAYRDRYRRRSIRFFYWKANKRAYAAACTHIREAQDDDAYSAIYKTRK